MKPFKQLTVATLCAAAVALGSNALCAYEQGTYFIYDLVEKIDASTVAKRLPVQASLLVAAKNDAGKDTTTTITNTAEKKSEFEIDFSSIKTSTGSTFKSAITIEIDDGSAVKMTDDTSTFDFNTTQTSTFGEY
jgi:hypothetical protein